MPIANKKRDHETNLIYRGDPRSFRLSASRVYAPGRSSNELGELEARGSVENRRNDASLRTRLPAIGAEVTSRRLQETGFRKLVLGKPASMNPRFLGVSSEAAGHGGIRWLAHSDTAGPWNMV